MSWTLTEFQDGHAFVYDEDMSFVANVNTGDEKGKSRAVLITAAPELLEALEDMIEDAERQMLNPSHHMPFSMSKAKAAIAKATVTPTKPSSD